MSFIRQFLSLHKWIKILIIFILLWGVIVFVFVSKLGAPNLNEKEHTIKRLNQAINYLEQTKTRNFELKGLIDEYLSDNNYRPDKKYKLIEDIEKNLELNDVKKQYNSFEPSSEYEQLRRRIYTNMKELGNYIEAELKDIKDVKTINNIIEMVNEHKRSLLGDLDELKSIDGYDNWRVQESKSLSDLVQRRLEYLQNPEDCSKARKLVCRLNKGCGYGCQLHHVVYCFIMAYATERTMILTSVGWRYHKAGWEEIFKPVSDTCTDAEGKTRSTWPGQYNTQVISLPIIDSLNPRPGYLPLAIPADLAPRLVRLHGDPIVWWIGQFLKYLLKPQPTTQRMLDEGIERLGFKKPIVGIHVRRTDKVGTEAAFHGIEEYMAAVEEYYKKLEMTEHTVERRVFVASDDPKVISEARKLYPQYYVVGDADVAKTAALPTRYSDSSLSGIILDIHLLSLSDYLVCTFSSQVCRIAYEIMQSMYPDASDRFKSLDDIYYYGGQNSHNREAVLKHVPKVQNEIHMNVGDLIGIAGNHWNGYSKGKNLRTNQAGLFPSFKVNDKIETADFPTYSHVK